MTYKDRIKEKYNSSLLSGDIEEIQNIILELNSLSVDEKKDIIDLYTQIGDDLFEKNIKILNYDLNGFLQAISNPIKNSRKQNSKKRREQTIESFDNIFCEFYKNSEDIFPDLKYHFLFQMPSDLSGITNLLIITDERFSDNPLLAKIISRNSKINPQKFTAQEFLDLIIKNPSFLQNQYILLLAISPTAGINKEFLVIKDIFSKLTNCSSINPHKACGLNKGDYSYRKVDSVSLDKIEKITTNFLNNKAINHEEEKIIKLLLAKNTSLTDYTILKSGFSGSKVIQVQSVRDMPGSSPVKNVIKFSPKTEEAKIYHEKETFREFVQELKVEGYAFDYDHTELYEGILYNYASFDSRVNSYSFAYILSDYLSNSPKLSYNLIDIIHELFNCAPFQKWIGLLPINESIKKLYTRYLDELKVLTTLKTIENKDEYIIRNDQLFINYEKILHLNLETNQKISHGDLHTENFFKDDNNVYLIDFGYTNTNHALLDYTTLEASIKFKHIPFYIPLTELLDIEKKLLDYNSFENGFDLSFIKRPKLKSLFEVILKIRNESLINFRNPKNTLEYFVSLFMISFRQIQYRDLNQLYALEYAKILSNHICDHMGNQ